MLRRLLFAVFSGVWANVWALPNTQSYTLYPDGRVEIAPGRKLTVMAYPHAWRGKSATQHFLDETNATDTATWSLRRDGDVYGKGRTTLPQGADGKVRCRFELEMTADLKSEGIVVATSLPAAAFVGAQWEDSLGHRVEVPTKMGVQALASGKMDWFSLLMPKGEGSLPRLSFPGGADVQLEDGRAWGPSLTLRITMAPRGFHPRGAKYVRELVFDTPGEIRPLLTISEGDTHVPFAFRKRIVPGSALDFSTQGFLDGPAGKYGPVRNVAGHFEFEGRPGERLRFWGTNLSIDATVVDHETALSFLDTLSRTGYNTIRIHNSERQFLQGSPDGLTLNEANMERFDFLFAEGKKRGFYFTTDLFIQRDTTWRALGVDRDGTCPWYLMKALILVHDGAYANWQAFARNLLTRRNRYTGLTYAEDPASAFLALINEGFETWRQPMQAFDEPLVRARWKAWLAAKRLADPAFHPEAPADCAGVTLETNGTSFAVLDLFVGEHERAFCRKARGFLRSLGVKALLTDWNCGPRIPATQQAVTDELDYEDRHFYVDHPRFVLSDGVHTTAPNRSPAAFPDSHPGARVTFARVPGRPLTVSEWNHCGPSPYRAIGGLMTGAFACLRDWDALWHFNYVIVAADAVDGGGRWDWFTIANDPMMIFTARMGALLYLRREIAPLPADAPFVPSALSGPVAFGRKNSGSEFLTVATARSAGLFARAGETVTAGALTARVEGSSATVFASALEGQSLAEAKRAVLFHLTDTQLEGCRFPDETYSTMLFWKENRPLVHAGAATITLRLVRPQECEVWALETDGSRVCRVDSRVEDGCLCFTARVAQPAPHFAYEIVRCAEVRNRR